MRSYRLFQCCTLYQCPRNCWQRNDRFDLCHRLSSKSSLYPCQMYFALAIFQFRSPFLLTTRNPSNTIATTFFVHHSAYIQLEFTNEMKNKNIKNATYARWISICCAYQCVFVIYFPSGYCTIWFNCVHKM